MAGLSISPMLPATMALPPLALTQSPTAKSSRSAATAREYFRRLAFFFFTPTPVAQLPAPARWLRTSIDPRQYPGDTPLPVPGIVPRSVLGLVGLGCPTLPANGL